MTKIHIGYVLTDKGRVLLQIPAENAHGFALADGDQSWPGGFGIASDWEPLADDDQRITDEDREAMQWLLDEAR